MEPIIQSPQPIEQHTQHSDPEAKVEVVTNRRSKHLLIGLSSIALIGIVIFFLLFYKNKKNSVIILSPQEELQLLEETSKPAQVNQVRQNDLQTIEKTSAPSTFTQQEKLNALDALR